MNTPTDDTPLSGQQIQTIIKQASAALQEGLNRIELRRKVLELAASVCVGNPEALVPLAREMLQFASEPAQDVTIKIERIAGAF